MPEGAYKSDHPLTTPPVRARTLHDIETLITHFLNVSWGPVIPAGEACVAIEASKGINAYYLVSDGDTMSYRTRIRTPSFPHLQMIPLISRGSFVADLIALKYVQSRHGWVNDAQLAAVAEVLGMSAAELDSVATFYNLIFRKPVGEHVIFLCDSVSCWIMGRERVAAKLHELLGISQGETTKEGNYTLLPIVCLGHCDHAPAMLVDETLYGDVDAAQLDAIFGIRA